MIKIWSDIAWNGYCQFFEKNQKNLIKSTHDLIISKNENKLKCFIVFLDINLCYNDKKR